MTYDEIIDCVLELSMEGKDGKILFITKYRQTAKRTIERMNDFLKHNGYKWRVELFKNKDKRFPYGAKVVSQKKVKHAVADAKEQAMHEEVEE